MKRNRAATIYWLLIIGTVCYNSLFRSHPFVKEGYWRATLTLAGKEVPFNLEVRGTHADNAKLFLLNNGQRTEVVNFVQHQDTLVLALDSYQILVKARIEKQSLAGEAIPLHSQASAEGMPFRAEHGRRHPKTITSLLPVKGTAAFTGLTSLH